MMNCPDNSSAEKILFNIPLKDLDYNYLYERINKAVNTRQKIIIDYLNANTVRLISNDKLLKTSILSADIIHPDGVGIWLASRLIKNSHLKIRFNFTDCSLRFLKDCQENEWSLFLVGSKNKTLQKAILMLKKEFPKLRIAGALNGYHEAELKNAVKYINEKSPDIVWVGMGTPKQELWIENNKEKLNCSVIQSVGDLITYFAGEKTRGPVFIRKIGLEWMARLLRHPVRYFNRYAVGIPIFVFILLREISIKQKTKQYRIE